MDPQTCCTGLWKRGSSLFLHQIMATIHSNLHRLKSLLSAVYPGQGSETVLRTASLPLQCLGARLGRRCINNPHWHKLCFGAVM